MTQNIYFDESGYTGDNLLHKEQKYFSYGSVASSDEESKDVVQHIIKKYNIQNGELKGSKLVNSDKGLRAVDEILTIFDGRIRSVVSDKKYALAGKYYEYVFEPALAEKSSIFYDLNFHRFIANYLHVELVSKDETAELLHNDFELIMRSKKNATDIFITPSSAERTQVFNDILDFTNYNKEKIQEEIDSLEGVGSQKWILDLTTTSLFNLLADWGQRYEQVNAICDNSKPLAKNKDFYDVMIQRTERKYQIVRGQKLPMTFNLANEIIFSDSKETYGIQIADVIAATSIYMLNVNKTNDKFYKKWINRFEESIYYWQCCVVPSYEHLDLNKLETLRNCYILSELAERSKNGNSLLDNIEKEIIRIDRVLKMYSQ
ncbi:TPA: DUF3800 domain-containing protein [Serratia fonticola]